MKFARERQSEEYLERRRQQERVRSAQARAAHRRNQRLAVLERVAFHYDPDINFSEHPDLIIETMDKKCDF